MSSTPSATPRLDAELALLHSMYPTEIRFDDTAQQLTYNGPDGTITLRTPHNYPSSRAGPLTVIAAHAGPSKRDIRQRMIEALRDLPSEEVLDLAITSFRDIASEFQSPPSTAGPPAGSAVPLASGPAADPASSEPLTAIVWLHHLLSTAKRKQILDPPRPLAGLSKPGYPGVLLFTGPAAAVREHVDALKRLRWQAFQVRAEVPESWALGHGDGVREVEALGDVVSGVVEGSGADRTEMERRKEVVLEALRMK